MTLAHVKQWAAVVDTKTQNLELCRKVETVSEDIIIIPSGLFLLFQENNRGEGIDGFGDRISRMDFPWHQMGVNDTKINFQNFSIRRKINTNFNLFAIAFL